MARWVLDATDGLWRDPDADSDCKTCNGTGVVDDGSDYGCILIPCPDCCGDKK